VSEPKDAAGIDEPAGETVEGGARRARIARLARAVGLGEERLDRSDDVSRLARHGWIAGVAGTFAVLGMGYVGSRRHALEQGWHFLSPETAARAERIWPDFFGAEGAPVDKNRVMVLALLVVLAVMLLIEVGIRLRVDRGSVIARREDAFTREFFGECILVYAVELALFTLGLVIYRSASEYGFSGRGSGYYQPWFNVMEAFRDVYFVGGLPYVILTRAFQHDPKADRKQAAFTVLKAVRYLAERMRAARGGPPEPPLKLRAKGKGRRRLAASASRRYDKPASPLDKYDRTAMLGLGVKAFFVPLMTVFFCDQFFHLVKNYDFLLDAVPQRSPMTVTVREIHDVGQSVIFSVDVGLAWAGYVASSRWIKNGMFSVEPTTLGWASALLCYPPINQTFGHYFSTPGETGFLTMDSKGAIIVFASFSIVSFSVYTASTACFGLRFSNLTHRGIITTGPYALVRHPAYASKNFSWWCVMLPFAIYQARTALGHAVGREVVDVADVAALKQMAAYVVGLVALSGMYYVRARTEERHLRRDPEYRDYTKKVPWRFVPGLV
jgi:protein-S-isoprenylcysteine O-methyltransferase Ste14